ncbi:MAG: hypothetical protein WDZ77_01815 [Candidatus Pacearchaeota archaeon]
MNCDCKWVEVVLALVVLIFTIWSGQILSTQVSEWLVVIAAALLLIHSLACKKCFGGMKSSTSKSKKRR